MGGALKSNLLVIIAIAILFANSTLSSAEFYSISVSGKDGAAGYIKSSDTLAIKTESMLPVGIDFTQESNYTPMSCDSGTPIRCSYTKQITNASSLLQVTLQETGSLIVKNIPVYIDMSAPVIQYTNFRSLGNSISVDFTVTDSSALPGKCSGIKTAELYLNGKLVSNANFTREQCTITTVLQGAIPNFDGIASTSIVTYDYLGHKVNKTGPSLEFDSIPPKIASLVTVYKAGSQEKITSLPKGGLLNVDIVINVTDNELSSVSANFFQLNADSTFALGSCEAPEYSNASRSCIFRSVPINLQNTNQKAIFFAEDIFGNIVNLTASLPIALSTPRFFVTVTATNAGNTSNEETNITKIPGPNSTKSVPVNLAFTARYDSPLELKRIIVETSQINTGGQLPAIDEINNISVINGSMFLEATECESDGNLTISCSLQSVQVRASVQNPKLTIYGIDESGVVSIQQVSPLWTVISSAGKVTSILPSTEKCLSGVCYLSADSQIVSAIVATSSSFYQNQIKINNVNAICSPAGSNWICNATVAGAESLNLVGFDDLGNKISGQNSVRIILDKSKPELISQFSVTPVCPTSSDSLTIQVNSTDSGGSPSLIISADASEISAMNKTQTKTGCTSISSSNHVCTLKIGNLLNEGKNANIKVSISDLAGNKIDSDVPVSICSVVTGSPDVIKKIQTTGILPKIDRKVASKISTLKIPLGLASELNTPGATILEKSKISCNSANGVSDAYLINEDSANPTLILTLKYSQSWTDLSNLNINCSQDFKIRLGNQIYSLPEKENFIVNLELINNPLGTIDEAYSTKLSNIKQELRETEKTIVRWQKVENTVGRICDTAQKINEINVVVQNVKVVLWAAMNVVDAVLPGTGEAIWNKVGGAMNEFHSLVSTKIWPQGWFKNGQNNYGLVLKYSCSVYACKYYDMQTYMSIGMEYLANRRNSNDESVSDDDVGCFSDDPESSCYKPTGQPNKPIDVYEYDETGRTLIVYPDGSKEYRDLAPPIDSRNIQIFTIDGKIKSSYSPSVSQNNPSIEEKIPAWQKRMPKSLLKLMNGNNKNIDPKILEGERFDMRLNSALDAFTDDASTWIYNPYKSENYDNLCIPATLYNSKKKRQLLCKQLGCIQEMAKNGGPIEACEFDYELASCMYVESARHKLETDSSTFENIVNAAWSTSISNVAGIGTAYAYLYVVPGCASYQSRIGGPNLEKMSLGSLKSPSSIKSLACGTLGTALSMRELQATFNGNFNKDNSPTNIPGPDFCTGVNYND